MKHKRLYTGIIMAAAALGCLSSCKKDETLSEGPTVQMVLSEFNSGSTQKTYIGENYVPLWTDNDIVNINGTACPLTGIDGMRAEVTLPDQSGTYAAVYPAAAVIGELTSGGGSVEIPSKQEYSTTSDGKQIVRAPMAAYMEGERTLYFRNLAALLKVTVYNNNENTLKVYSISAEAATQHLSGTLPFSFGGSETQVDGDAITLGTLSDGGKQVKLSCGLTGVSIGKGESKDFYLVVAPYTTADKLTFTVEGNAKGTSIFYNFVLPQNTAKTLTRNQVGTAPFASDFNYGEFNGFGRFSVAEDRVVTFSPGNLQYRASTDSWRFAENQWDVVRRGQDPNDAENLHGTVIGSDNTLIGEHYSGWIDLFGWGTSGYNNKYPWQHSENYQDYAYPGEERDIAGTDYDWGVYNTTTNHNVTYKGKTVSSGWRTLTADEWDYLLIKRSGWNYDRVEISGTLIHGMIVYPDGTDAGQITAKLGSDKGLNGAGGNNCILTKDEFSTLETMGCIFLPEGGQRSNTNINEPNSMGFYWSVTNGTHDVHPELKGQEAAYMKFKFTEGEHFLNAIALDDGSVRYKGYSVRLVRDVQ